MDNQQDILDVEVETGTEVVEAPVVDVVTPTTPVAEAVIPEVPIVPTITSFEEGLKNLGLTPEDLAELKAQRDAKIAETEKPFNEQKEWAEKVNFGVKNKLITKEDEEKRLILSTKTDMELAFENFDFVPEEEGLSEAEIAEAKQDAFNEAYHLNSFTEKIKERGQRDLKADAERIRNEHGIKFENLNKEFTEQQVSASFFQDRQAILNELNANGYSETINVDGKQIVVEIPIPTTEAEVKNMLTSDTGSTMLVLMRDVYKQNPEQAKELFKQFVVDSVKKNAIVNTVFQEGVKVGKESSIGATAPFNSNQQIRTDQNSPINPVQSVLSAMGLDRPY